MNDRPTSSSAPQSLAAQLRSYDACFAEFLKPSGNGQKLLQASLIRAAFQKCAARGVAIRADVPTSILDVSCGPGDFSVTWTSDVAEFLPRGMIFYCTDHPQSRSLATGERYTAMTAAKIREAGRRGDLVLAGPPVATDADLFAGDDRLMPPGRSADIVHWSHSGYHGRDALGRDRDNPAAIEAAIGAAVEKMWAALDPSGMMVSVHQTRDTSDGVPSQMLPVSRPYCGAVDNVPELTERRVRRLGGHVATVPFATPLCFVTPGEADWEALKRPAEWERLGPAERRNLLLLNFSAYDSSGADKAALERLAETGRLAAYVDAFKDIVVRNGGYILVKCAFQMISKTSDVASRLTGIAADLRADLPRFRRDMTEEMARAAMAARL
ncbi:MAG: hypothetical protein JO255_10970 [Alphaproteobacteria bacterium]|nr:hypothetical protein [Alphaproteobacteria bacterium]